MKSQASSDGFRALARKIASRGAVLCAVVCSAAGTSSDSRRNPQPRIVQFDGEGWQLADGAEIVSFGGRTALSGSGCLKGVSFLNGTVEADVWATGEINFAGFAFRVQSFDEHEWFWLRMHKTNGLVADAVQYAPAFHGVFCWQLNPTSLAPANLPKNQWVHMKLEFLDRVAALYVDDMSKPVKVVDRLRGRLAPGSVGVKVLQKGSVYFSNFSYRIDDVGRPAATKPDTAPPNVLVHWQLSPSYPVQSVDAVPDTYPVREIAGIERWIVPEADETGLINISRYHGTRFHGRVAPAGGRPNYAILRAFIDADRDRRVKMNFGYSDAATIFLNRAPLFWGNSAFLSRDISYGGWISFNDAVFLDLKKGRNELLAVVAEDFGGWGFQAKLADVDGLRLVPAPPAD